MQHLNLIILAAIFIMTFSVTSCNQTSKSDNKEKSLTEKENELLKKENELLKKEQGLNQKAVKPTTDNQTAKQQQSENAVSDNLDFLNKLDKKYPYEIKLFDNPILKNRLKKMLGSQYDFMQIIWEVETPIEITNGLFYAWGMQAHSGGDPSAVLMADINKNILYVGIRKDEQVKIYTEDGSKAPQRLQDWANGQ